nr:hypothetical protein [Rhodoplanes roseus]
MPASAGRIQRAWSQDLWAGDVTSKTQKFGAAWIVVAAILMLPTMTVAGLYIR